MSRDYGPKQLKLKKGDDQGMFDCISLEGQNRSLHANTKPPPAEGNFCDDSNCAMKPHIMEWYHKHMGYINNSDRMANSYLMSQHTFKWNTLFFFSPSGSNSTEQRDSIIFKWG
jgi:hypothetical protein